MFLDFLFKKKKMTTVKNDNLREFLLELVQRKVPGISKELYTMFVEATVETIAAGFFEISATDGFLKLNKALEQAEYRKSLENKISPRLDSLSKDLEELLKISP